MLRVKEGDVPDHLTQQDLSYEQICEFFNMSLPAVKSLLFRARTEFRKHLASYLGED
jgi:RNA polymerase sigma-70 factor (ECF subfamily)